MTNQAHAHDAARQLVEHVGDDGSVIGVVTRAEMRAQALRHRCVYIAVTDSRNRLLVHKRADWKDVSPGAWDLAFGGVCDVGEGWRAAAERELSEEAGIAAELSDCGPVAYSSPELRVIGRLYTCRHEGPFSFDDGEVTATRWIEIQQLGRFVREHEIPEDSAAILTARSLTPGEP